MSRHQRYVVFLQVREQPIKLAFAKRGRVARQSETASHAQHAGLPAPVGDLRVRIGCIEVKAAKRAKAIRVFARGIEHEVVASAIPRRRHEDAARDAGGIHFLQQQIRGERWFAVGDRAGEPRALWRMGRPDVYLGIGYEHVLSTQRFDIRDRPSITRNPFMVVGARIGNAR